MAHTMKLNEAMRHLTPGMLPLISLTLSGSTLS